MYLIFKLLSRHYLLIYTYLTYIQHAIEYRTHVVTDDSRIITSARVGKIIAGKHLKKRASSSA